MFVAINYKKEMKKELFIACSLCGTMLVNAENIEVTTFKYAKRSHCWIRRCHFLCLKEQK